MAEPMTGKEIDEVSSALGAMQATIAALTQMWERNDREATEGRRRLYDKVDELKAQNQTLTTTVGRLTMTVEAQAKELAEVKPALKRFEAQRQHAEGQKSMIKVAWIGIVAFATGLGYMANFALQLLWPPKH